MEMKKMIVGFLVIFAFALPAFATVEKDIITPEGIKMAFGKEYLNLDEETISALTGKILISNPVIEEALLKHSNFNARGGNHLHLPCGQTCVFSACESVLNQCVCQNRVCVTNSLDD